MDTYPPNEIALDLIGKLEALLFVAPGEISLEQLSRVLEISIEEIKTGLHLLEEKYLKEGGQSGIQVQWNKNKVQLTSHPAAAKLIEKLYGLEITGRLTRAALETLAIIAYRQPVTRPQIDSIRGVNSDGVIKNLLSKGFIEEIGRSEAPGRPFLYATTSEFLQAFGLASIDHLPPLDQD